ncbi:hypothetical protein SAVIM338S_03242 [Streptomyces avidinii]
MRVFVDTNVLFPFSVMARVAGGKRNPPMTWDEVVARLGKAGVTRFAERLG